MHHLHLMKSINKVLITDSFTKQSIAISKYLKRDCPELIRVGVLPHKVNKCFLRIYKMFYDEVTELSLKEIVVNSSLNIDLIIPVWASSVQLLIDYGYEKCVLPDKNNFRICLDKYLTYTLVEELSLDVPKTYLYNELNNISFNKKYVVKQRSELDKDMVYYVSSKDGVNAVSYKETCVIQEYVEGKAIGFFAVYSNGKLMDYYMHERIMEYPITGGPSVAAKTIYNEKVYLSGKKLLDTMNWHGVAMVEFKFDENNNKAYVIEINPKFWGSTELGLKYGINFGKLIINIYLRHAQVKTFAKRKHVKFFWPLDNHLLAIFKSGRFFSLVSYFRLDYSTNISIKYILYKLVRMINKLVQRS